MTTAIAIVGTESHELAALTVDDLRHELKRQIEVTAAHVARLASIWMELERRGEDLSALRSGIANYLPAVAGGRLLPDAVVRLAGNRPALRALSLLRLDDQRTLIANGVLDVRREHGVDSVPLARLTQGDISRAFDTVNGRILPPAEQRPYTHRAARVTSAFTRRVVLSLTEAEHDALQAHAERARRSAADLVRKIIERDGVLKR